MKIGTVYYIESAATGRLYVGSTARAPRQRWLEHLHYLRNGKHHCRHLQRVYAKHGEHDLTFSIVEHVDDILFLLAREQFHIWRHEGRVMNGVPVSDALYAAHAGNRGRVMPDDERARRSAIAKGKPKGPFSEEHKAALRTAWERRRAARVGRQSHITNELPTWLAMRQQGMTFRQIAEATGRDRHCIAREVRAAGCQ
ncbi:GIY-YIG domain-containing protein [Burkholderia phage BcepMigl]|uniref:GIY-YIG domain-containing protein n=1 Tax=Burkholderia phage BcepMigl TaxID=2886899 RepID=I6WLP4_9CAUD|nr:GIY-YIG domain-containing protein [Burkholderia phage BcepMigl]AFN39113.1 GIY-YIG domain-containing protein [Burkholderia phage BcepMigl]